MRPFVNISGFLIVVGIVFLGSCRKDTPDNPEEFLDQRGAVYLNIHHVSDTLDFQLNTTYFDDYGNAYEYTRADIYLSQPKLMNTSLGEYNLIHPGESEYYLGKAEAGHYHTLSFNIGVDSLTNHSDPTSYDPDHALYFQSPSMHWDWNLGYLFITIEGNYDADGDTIMDNSFLVHVGSDALLRDTTLTVHKDIVNQSKNVIDVTLNWAALVNDIDLTTDNSSHTGNNIPLATKVADNAKGAFSSGH